MTRAWVAALLLLASCGSESTPAPTTTTAPAEEATLGGRPMSEYFIEHDRFLPATDPATVTRAQATFLLPSDEVFGVVEGGRARAYPVTMLSYHHVVNDVLGGVPIAVTY